LESLQAGIIEDDLAAPRSLALGTAAAPSILCILNIRVRLIVHLRYLK
jgi:hypothetical protein